MIKKITILVTILFTLNGLSQSFSYGPMIGYSAYDLEIDGPLQGDGAFSGLNFGAFGEYQINKSFGAKANLLYSRMNETSYSISGEKIFQDVSLTTLQLHGLLKFDVNSEYNKGFYFIGGLRMTNILNIQEDNSVNDPEEFYKKTVVGAMLGFGVNFLKHYSLEVIPERNLSNTIDFNNDKARNYGIYLNFNVNLGSILSSKKE